MEPEENEAVVATTLRDGARLLSAETVLGALPGLREEARALLCSTALTPDGCLRTTPGVQPSDGFFAAVLAID